MNAIHSIFAVALAPITPSSDLYVKKDFAVTIKFADGEYRNRVRAETEERAKQLAMIDARMGSPFAAFYGKVISSCVVPA